jgi:hypothetical protein
MRPSTTATAIAQVLTLMALTVCRSLSFSAIFLSRCLISCSASFHRLIPAPRFAWSFGSD